MKRRFETSIIEILLVLCQTLWCQVASHFFLAFLMCFLLCFQALLMMQFVRSKWLLEPLVWSSWLPLERKLGCQEANLKCVSSKWTVFLQRTESRTKPLNFDIRNPLNRLFELKSGSESGNSNEIEHLLKKTSKLLFVKEVIKSFLRTCQSTFKRWGCSWVVVTMQRWAPKKIAKSL